MFCFCQMIFSRAEFGQPDDLGYEEGRCWGSWTRLVMSPQAFGEAAEAVAIALNLRGIQVLLDSFQHCFFITYCLVIVWTLIHCT